MKEKNYSLKTILQSVFSTKNNIVKKRLIYNMSILGGIDSKWIKILFIILPFVMYAAIFNPTSFESLGIAQAIVFYIILLVFAMQVVVGVSYFNNKRVIKKLLPSWQKFFPKIDFKMILSSGVTPYVDFIKHYELALKKNLDDVAFEAYLRKAFQEMEKENHILYDAIQKEAKKRDK